WTAAPEALSNVHRVAVVVAVLAEPRAVDEVHDVHNERVAFPACDRVAVVRRVAVLLVRAAHWNDPIGIARDVFIEKDELVRQLNNASRRANARNARPVTVEDRVGLAFVVEQVLHLRAELRLVDGRRREWQRARDLFRCWTTSARVDARDRRLPVRL